MRIITLSREYGAGGHSVGQRVAAELGIEFYDKDIIRGSAEEMGGCLNRLRIRRMPLPEKAEP